MGAHQLSVEACDNRERELRDWLQMQIDAEGHKLRRLRDKITQAMAAYKEAFKLETAEVDASVEAGFEYRVMLDSLQADDFRRGAQLDWRGACDARLPGHHARIQASGIWHQYGSR